MRKIFLVVVALMSMYSAKAQVKRFTFSFNMGYSQQTTGDSNYTELFYGNAPVEDIVVYSENTYTRFDFSFGGKYNFMAKSKGWLDCYIEGNAGLTFTQGSTDDFNTVEIWKAVAVFQGSFGVTVKDRVSLFYGVDFETINYAPALSFAGLSYQYSAVGIKLYTSLSPVFTSSIPNPSIREKMGLAVSFYPGRVTTF